MPASLMQYSPVPSLPQDMHSCSALVGRLPCPCKMFHDGTSASVCDACLHSLSQHIPSDSTSLPLLESPITGPTPVRARSVTSLFQTLLKSTPGGSLAVRETSNGFRKSGSSTAAVGYLGVGCEAVSDGSYRALPVYEDRPHAA